MKSKIKNIINKAIALVTLEIFVLTMNGSTDISNKSIKSNHNNNFYPNQLSLINKGETDDTENVNINNNNLKQETGEKTAVYTGLKDVEVVESNRVTVTKNKAAVIKYKDIKLEIPKGSVENDTVIEIVELDEIEKLEPGMENVTKGTAGYRFLPDGMQFTKNIFLTIPYNREKLVTEDDLASLYTYFYNETDKVWVKLDRVKIDTDAEVLVSATTHFTDMINSVLKLPESPKPLSFNPTSIKDIKAADPLAEIPKIEGLEPGSFGSANFSIPLRIPAGRNGLTPSLSLSYNSEVKNGLMGVGFDINIPEISIDTKFGLPDYKNQLNNTYLLNGAELVYIGAEGTGESTEYIYEPRVEGSFSKIRKKSDGSFVVTEKDGTKYIYGYDYISKSYDALLNGGKGNYKYHLKRIIDTNNNTILYNYTDGSGYKYIESIVYTGYINGINIEIPGKYHIIFKYETGRKDEIINCRGKFVSKVDRRISGLEMRYDSQLIRKYKFEYEYNDFEQSNIINFIEYDGSGNETAENEFYRYNFTYKPMPKSGGDIQGFQEVEEFGSYSDLSEQVMSRNHSLGGGGSCYIGVGIGYSYLGFTFSFGLSIGFNLNYSYDTTVFMDINGDNLPDIVNQNDFNGLNAVLNGENGNFHSEPFEGIDTGLNEQFQAGFDINASGAFGPISGSIGGSFNWSNSLSTFIDMNGDGLVDFIPAKMRNGYYKNTGSGFTTEYFDNSFSVNVPDAEGNNDAVNTVNESFYLVDPVKKWKAYHRGKIAISGLIEKKDDPKKESDGVKVNLYRNGESIWNNIENPGDWSEKVKNEQDRRNSVLLNEGGEYSISYQHNDEVNVEKGDSIYFRVNSIDKVEDDIVSWNPEIYYKEIYYHEFMEDYDCGIITKILQPDEFVSIKDSLEEPDKSYFIAGYDPIEVQDEETGDIIIDHYDYIYVNDVTESNIRSIFAERGQILPKRIELELFEGINEIDTNCFKYYIDYILIEQTDKDFINEKYKKGPYKDYYYLDENITEAERQSLYTLLKPKIDQHINSFKYYKYDYHGSKYIVKRDSTGYYIQLKYKNETLPNNLIKKQDAVTTGESTNDGILVDAITRNDGTYIKKWIKDETNKVFFTIDDNGTEAVYTANESAGITYTRNGNTITLREECEKYDRIYKIEKSASNNLPVNIDKDIYFNLYNIELEKPISYNDFNNVILTNPLLATEVNFIKGCYNAPALPTGSYTLKPGTTTADRLKLINLYFLISYANFKQCYDEGVLFYTVKSSVPTAYRNIFTSLLTNSKLIVYAKIDKRINVSSEPAYDVVKTPYVSGIVEEEIVRRKYEKNLNKAETSYILTENFNAQGNVEEKKDYIHVFKSGEDFELLNRIANYADIPKEMTVSEYNRNESLLANKEDENTGYKRYHKNFFKSMYREEGGKYILNEEMLEELYNSEGSATITKQEKLSQLFLQLGYGGEYFTGGTYCWTHGEWNGNFPWSESFIGVTDENKDFFYFNAMAEMPADFLLNSQTEADKPENQDTTQPDDDDMEGGFEHEYENKLKKDLWKGSEFSYKERTRLTEDSPDGSQKAGDLVDVEKYFLSYISVDNEFSPTRVGGDANNKIPTDSKKINAQGLDGLIRSSFSAAGNYSAGLAFISKYGTWGESYGERDIFDINGDRYPDKIIFPFGGSLTSVYNFRGKGFNRNDNLNNTFQYLRQVYTNTEAIGLSITSAMIGTLMDFDMNDTGTIRKTGPKKAEFCMGGGVKGGIGSSQIWIDWIDMNGDGLVDHVQRNGSGGFDVKLNLGDGFSTYPDWSSSGWGNEALYYSTLLSDDITKSNVIKHDTTSSVSFDVSIGCQYISGNANVGITGTKTKVDLIDMNGDGLPDEVLKVDDKPFKIRYNLGSRFSEKIYEWETPAWSNLDNVVSTVLQTSIDVLTASNGGSGYGNSFNPIGGALNDYMQDINLWGVDDVISHDVGINVGIGIVGTIAIPCGGLIPITLYISPGGNFAYGMTTGNLKLTDFDGDGLPDHVLKLSWENGVKVKLNNAKQVGLLTDIACPSGQNIKLYYEKKGNKEEMPNSMYVLSKVERYDGFEKDESGNDKIYTVDYDYEGGNYSREERTFYGFSRVTQLNQNETKIVKTYLNGNYWEKGILTKTELITTADKLLSSTEYNYIFQVIHGIEYLDMDKSVKYPRLTKETTINYDINDSLKSIEKSTEYVNYDQYGNVTEAYDRGESSNFNANLSDDIRILINYTYDTARYIVNTPDTLIVRGHDNNLLRQRTATYFPDGSLKTLKQRIMDNVNIIDGWAETSFTYDQYGNMKSVTDPDGYTIFYEYEGIINTFIEKIRDDAQYESEVKYDYLLQKEIETTDINNNIMGKKYDRFGRLIKVWTGYDNYNKNNDTGNTAVEFIYYNDLPRRTVTKNKIFTDEREDTLDTVITADGFGRIMQTKKEGVVLLPGNEEPSYGMNVSGMLIYDNMGQIIKQGQPVFQTGYNIQYFDAELKNPTKNFYDVLGRVTDVKLPDGNYIHNTYSIENKKFVTTVEDPNGNRKISYSDSMENIVMIEQFRKVKETDPFTTVTTTYEYNVLGEIIKVTDDKSFDTTITYDTLGRRTSIDNPDSGKITYKYSNSGNIIEKVDANLKVKSQKITYEYDDYNRLKKINYPNMTDVEYFYGENGAEYNRAGRIYKITDESGSSELFYGLLGETIKADKKVYSQFTGQTRLFEFNYKYDYLGRAEWIQYPGKTSNTATATHGETVHYVYDEGGQITRVYGKYDDVAEEIDYVKNIYYDEFGQRVYLKYGNNVETNYTYDEHRRWLTNLKTKNGNDKLFQNISYNFDNAGNIHNITNSLESKTVTQKFEYDTLYQLIHSEGDYTKTSSGINRINRYSQDYTYDTIGNMTAKESEQSTNYGSTTKGLNYDLTYKFDNKRPHRAVKIGDYLYNYDSNGNVTKKYRQTEMASGDDGTSNESTTSEMATYPNSANEAFGYIWTPSTPTESSETNYIWNEENRLKQVLINNKTINFSYNAGGDRMSKYVLNESEILYPDKMYQVQVGIQRDCITMHVFVGDTRVISKITYEDIPDNGQTEKDNTYFYHGDHLGSSNYITDINGNEYEHLEYTPYGESWIEEGDELELKLNKIKWKFTSKELDSETGLYYFGARYLDPQTSRWMSPDPIYDGLKEGLSIYGYCRNNPIILKDPNGLLSSKTEASMVQAGLGYTNLKIYTSDYYDALDEKVEGLKNGVSALFDLFTGFPFYSILNNMSNSSDLKELSIAFFGGVGTWLLTDGLGGKLSKIGLTKTGGFLQYTDDFISYLTATATQYGINTSQKGFDSYIKNLFKLDEDSLMTKRNEAEVEFLKDFKDNFKNEYFMYFDYCDSGSELNINDIDIGSKDKVLEKMNQFKKDRINQGKFDYILVDVK